MGTIKTRWIDTNVITNIIKTLPKSNIHIHMKSNDHIRLIITDAVEMEVNIFIKNINNNIDCKFTDQINKLWSEMKKIITCEHIQMPIDKARGLGENSIVQGFIKDRIDNKKIVSNDMDVLKLMKKNKIDKKFFQTPFVFYEECLNGWFDNNTDMIKFLILANHDFRIYDVKYIGNILRKYGNIKHS